jgi:hypothetical protein
MFLAIVGMGCAAIIPVMQDMARRLVNRLTGARLDARVTRALATGLVSAGLLFAFATGGAFRYTLAMLTVDDADWPYAHLYRGESDWGAAAGQLGPLVEQADVFIASAGPKALYALGRVDVSLFATELSTYLGQADDFSATTPLGRPIISRPESVEMLIDCHRTGLIVIERKHWRKDWAVPGDTSALIESRTRELSVDDAWRLRVFNWDNPQASGDCPPAI